jgi:hypothetical protein
MSRLSLVGLLGLAACGAGDTVTEVVSVPIKSDTYVVSGSEKARGGEKVLVVSDAAQKSNALVPLPSSDGEVSEDSFVQAVVDAIFEGIFGDGCDRSQILKPQFLTSVSLVLTPTDSAMTSLAAQVSVRPLARGWWQGATWTRAHPFTSEGRWATPGGDVLGSISATSGTAGTSGAVPTIEFDVKSLVSESTSVFEWGQITALNGLLVQASGGAELSFHSAQSDWGESYRPHLDFTYTGPCIPQNSGN